MKLLGKTMFSLLSIVIITLTYSVFIEMVDLRSHFFPLLNVPVEPCHIDSPLKVYMYDLPRRFNVGMFSLRRSNETPVTWRNLPPWPRNSGLGKQQSVEYWMMASLLSEGEDPTREAIRVLDPNLADAFFVPFFSSLSFNKHGRNMTDPATKIDRQLQVRVHFA
ncbi:hypothetical protein RHMOL_Rhmol12G0031500 [Rhododendron molle]|uniref:Uncharacterized protein n=1 Tax=Rhododendron molle TaxID=49168 RepID=A0ACC0LFG1_RHOML|nr:hypothetical protein RHMOL_Rhmol12G0031500 [Rhododendron molle]